MGDRDNTKKTKKGAKPNINIKDSSHMLDQITDIDAYIKSTKKTGIQKKTTSKKSEKNTKNNSLTSKDGTDLRTLENIYAIIPHKKGDHKLVWIAGKEPKDLRDDDKKRIKGGTYEKKGITIYEVVTNFHRHPTLLDKSGTHMDVWVVSSPEELTDQIQAIREGKGGGVNFLEPEILGNKKKSNKRKKKPNATKMNQETNKVDKKIEISDLDVPSPDDTQINIDIDTSSASEENVDIDTPSIDTSDNDDTLINLSDLDISSSDDVSIDIDTSSASEENIDVDSPSIDTSDNDDTQIDLSDLDVSSPDNVNIDIDTPSVSEKNVDLAAHTIDTSNNDDTQINLSDLDVSSPDDTQINIDVDIEDTSDPKENVNIDTPSIDTTGNENTQIDLSGLDIPSPDDAQINIDVDIEDTSTPKENVNIDTPSIDTTGNKDTQIDLSDLDIPSPDDTQINIDVDIEDTSDPKENVNIDTSSIDTTGNEDTQIDLSDLDIPSPDDVNIDIDASSVSEKNVDIDAPSIDTSNNDNTQIDLSDLDVPSPYQQKEEENTSGSINLDDLTDLDTLVEDETNNYEKNSGGINLDDLGDDQHEELIENSQENGEKKNLANKVETKNNHVIENMNSQNSQQEISVTESFYEDEDEDEFEDEDEDEDEFEDEDEEDQNEYSSWASENRKNLILGVKIIALLTLLGIGFLFYKLMFSNTGTGELVDTSGPTIIGDSNKDDDNIKEKEETKNNDEQENNINDNKTDSNEKEFINELGNLLEEDTITENSNGNNGEVPNKEDSNAIGTGETISDKETQKTEEQERDESSPENIAYRKKLVDRLDGQKRETRTLLNKARLINNVDALKFAVAGYKRAEDTIELLEAVPEEVTLDVLERNIERIDLYIKSVRNLLD